MTKAFRALIVGLMFSGMLAACGGTADTGAPTAASSAASTGASTVASTGSASASAMTSESASNSAMASESASASAMASESASASSAAMSETATSGSMTANGEPLASAKPDTSVSAELKGSGSSFVAKVMQKWVQDYKGVVAGVTINYQSVGSGQGVTDFTNNVTDFGASDAFLTDQELQKAPNALHIPVVAGAVVATYNLPGVDKLQFSPETLAGIFLGTITKWNDPKIAADNQGVTLPDTNITVVYRADGSGTTSIFTTYLSSVSPEWKQKVGAGKTVQWPTGRGEQKNDGVAAAVKGTEGAIGYVELIYALGNKLPAPAIKNAAGKFVTPALESVTAAADGFSSNLPDDLRLNIVNPPQGENAYPISGFTWVLLRKEMQDETKAKALTDFLYWTLANGDEQAKSLGYSPLSNAVKQKAVNKLEQVTVNGKQVFKRP